MPSQGKNFVLLKERGPTDPAKTSGRGRNLRYLRALEKKECKVVTMDSFRGGLRFNKRPPYTPKGPGIIRVSKK